MEMIILLGALLADAPHTRPVPVSIGSSNAELATEIGVGLSDYKGPTGIVGVMQHTCTAAGIPTVSLWAQVPHYVAQPPSPKVTLALLRGVEDILDVPLPLADLPEESRAWERGVDELAQQDSEVADYVRTLEEAKDAMDLPEASGDAIAREFERYFRRHGGAPDPGGSPHRVQDPPDPARRRLPRSLDGAAVVGVFCLLMVLPSGVTRLASSDTIDLTGLRGTVSVLQIRGPSDQQAHQVWVWRPPGPDSATIPVLYFLHGDRGRPGTRSPGGWPGPSTSACGRATRRSSSPASTGTANGTRTRSGRIPATAATW